MVEAVESMSAGEGLHGQVFVSVVLTCGNSRPRGGGCGGWAGGQVRTLR